MAGTSLSLLTRTSYDATAVLAHVYLRFNRPAEAAALLAALVAVDPTQRPVRQALCLALLRKGDPAAALAIAENLLADAVDDDERVALLRLAAKADWRVGNADAARERLAEARAAANVSVGKPAAGRRP